MMDSLVAFIFDALWITQPFWETRDRRLDKETSTIHDLNHTGKKTNRGSSGLDSEYLVFVPHVKEVGLGHSSQIQFRWISHLPTLDKRTHTHSTFEKRGRLIRTHIAEDENEPCPGNEYPSTPALVLLWRREYT